MIIGKNIKKLRKTHQWTQKDLSQQLGLTPKMISFYENDERVPPADILIKLSEIFNVSTDYLLGLSDKELNATKSIIMDSDEEFLLSQYRKLNTEFKDIVITELKKYIKIQEYELQNNPEKPQKKRQA